MLKIAIFRRWMLALSLPLSFTTLFASTAAAQADPFDFGALDAPAPRANNSPEVEPVDDILIAELRRLAGGSPEQLGLALREVIRLRNWKELELYLGGNRIVGREPAALQAIARTVGGRLLARGASEPSLSDGAKQALQQLNQALIAAATDQAALDAAVVQLASENRDDQLAAARTLLGGGSAGLSTLLMAAVSPQPAAPLGRMVEVLKGFEQDAIGATEQVLIAGQQGQIAGAMKVLYGLAPEKAITPFAVLLYSPAANEVHQEIAKAGLQRTVQAIPAREEVLIALSRRMSQLNEDYRQALGSPGIESRWTLSEDGTEVQRVTVTTTEATAGRAADLARLIAKLGEQPPQLRVTSMQADLRERYLSNPAYGSAEDLGALGNRWGDVTSNPNLLSRILDVALGNRNVGGNATTSGQTADSAAAIAAIRLMAAAGNPDVVSLDGPRIAPLVAAVSDSHPRVRYEAAAAVGKLQPYAPYAGSNRVFRRWIDMFQLRDGARAIVLVNQLDPSLKINQRLEQMGLTVTRVSNVIELIREVDRGGDLQVIVATSRPPDFSAIELVDRVRRRPFGASVPLVLVGPPPAGVEQLSLRWHAPTRYVPLDQDLLSSLEQATGQMQAALTEMILALPVPPLSAADRQIFVLDGLASLSRLTERPELERLYPWREYDDELIDASRRSGYAVESLKVLSELGSFAAQETLISLMTNPGIDIGLRREAAASFVASVERFGTRLNRSQVVGLYARYNASEDEPLRELIGMALDAIEAKVGLTSKP